MKLPSITAFPLAAGLSLVLGSAVVATALEVLAPLPAEAQNAGNGRGNGRGPFQGGNNGNGPNPSRGNAGRNSGATSVSTSVLTPTVRFAPAPR